MYTFQNRRGVKVCARPPDRQLKQPPGMRIPGISLLEPQYGKVAEVEGKGVLRKQQISRGFRQATL